MSTIPSHSRLADVSNAALFRELTADNFAILGSAQESLRALLVAVWLAGEARMTSIPAAVCEE
ncbi:MAG TPA: hypothetical protein PKM73_11765 [Verrucomicrobiota bacterium]|nr:hypothetical protein [Verrucomicrobiota bacterium]